MIFDHRTGDDVCMGCGLATFNFLGEQAAMSVAAPMKTASPFDHLRDEIVEALMRMSCGDCAEIHVQRTLDKLQEWQAEKTDILRHLVSLGYGPEGIDRGILALALYQSLLDNGREEDLSHVGFMLGASDLAIARAEKLLQIGREYMSSEVSLNKIVDRLGLDSEWSSGISAIALDVAQVAFGGLDIIAGGVAIKLGRTLRPMLGEIEPPEGMVVDWPRMRAGLRLISGAAIQRQLGISGSASRRAKDKIGPRESEKVLKLARDLIKFKRSVTRRRTKQARPSSLSPAE